MDFNARLTHLGGQKLDKLSLKTEAEATAAVAAIKAQNFKIDSVEAKPHKRHPAPPFITSTLQQEASRKLGFGAKRTMQIAQQLYEGVDVGGETVGLITYMRTDGITMAAEAIAEARSVIGARYGASNMCPARRASTPARPRTRRKRTKRCARPVSHRTPDEAARSLDADQARLYELIWKRAVASQMESAELERTTVDVSSADRQITLRATGTVTLFDGFLTLYQEGKDDESDEDGSKLPRLAAGDKTDVEKVNSAQHFTEPPPRYSEASLVRKLEELGIGRPSTYASILSVLRDRAYVRMDRGPLHAGRQGPPGHGVPRDSFFHRYVEYDFTADLEEKLDEVAAGTLQWKQLLRDFWKDFSAAVGGTKDLKISHVIDEMNQMLGPHIFPPNARRQQSARLPELRHGRVEPEAWPLRRIRRLLQLSGVPLHAPAWTEQRQCDGKPAARAGHRSGNRRKNLAAHRTLRSLCPAWRRRRSRSAPAFPRAPKSKMSIFELALKLLSLPREVGLHPETGKMITANFGRFGPYVAHDGKYASLDSPDEVFTVGLNRAVTVIAEKKAKPRGRRGSEPLKELGNDTSGTPIKLMKGRFGPYVTDGTTNATVPNSDDPTSITLEQAVALIADRASKGGGKKKKGATEGQEGSQARQGEGRKDACEKETGEGSEEKARAGSRRVDVGAQETGGQRTADRQGARARASG